MDGLEKVDVHSSDSRYYSSNNGSLSGRQNTPMPFSLNDGLNSFEHKNNVGGSLDRLRSERQTSPVQMSGSLYVNTVDEVVFEPPQNVSQSKSTNGKQIHPFIHSTDEYDGTSDIRDEHLMKSRQLRMCDDPYCMTCPSYDRPNSHQKLLFTELGDLKVLKKFQSAAEAKNCWQRICSFLKSCIPRVMNPHTKVVQHWNKFFVISCLFAIFLDPLFFLLLNVDKAQNCIRLNWPMAIVLVLMRSITDFIYLLHILLQFRLAYIAPESRVVGAGELIDDPKKIAVNYLSRYFIFDFFAALPLPQIIIFGALQPSSFGSGANDAKNFLRAAILFQYIPRLFRFIPLLAGQSPTGFVFESAWANFVINLLTYMLASHVVGSCWYLFGLQRVNQCFRNACHQSNITMCIQLIDCKDGPNDAGIRNQWKNNENAIGCLDGRYSFSYGIYQNAVNLTAEQSLLTRYIYSFFWGFQQISTLAGNQTPSYFVWEVLFTMAILGIGLLLFALLIGNIQNFLQALGRRRLEMTLRRRDVERWMKHRRLPEELRRQVRESERFAWVATRGVNEEILMENLPEDLQRDIRRHLFKFVKKVRIFQFLDEPVIDAICNRLKTKTYVKGSRIIFPGGLVDKMVFIIRGKMETVEENVIVPLSEGDVCGEELLTWFLEHSSTSKNGKRIGLPRHRLLSNRTIKCLAHVEAFILRAADLEEVISLYARFLRNPRVQGAIRYESPYWRGLAARRIQVAWRYRKWRLSHQHFPSRTW
ncbi:probable cyclic nucleotide-gated ion channel 20, chloroplastic isoform X2 [Andrographis paniculata]|uniref:probable cyclic nucleotide-gated ion channel 20, chloroplastic isoform X2 n=1 Tax=Andrographis paniculata TaxID=175694 RepID=UPI0021E86911|nr:probable cyclic nucleotide-gated ion channel 20, chloroplastic isoform X2 [Andrographis paniculata]